MILLKQEWVRHALKLASTKADFYSGCRKILRTKTLSFYEFDDSLQLVDAGYTKTKMKYLERGYLHEESRRVSIQLWDRRRDQAKYGSVGFTTYNHFLKNDIEKKSKRASVMGPCIQSCTITWLNKKEVAIDVFYRTTEWLKKFPADLIFIRDVLLQPFNFEDMEIVEINCHFANITIHPMYMVTVLPSIENPLIELDRIKLKDRFFFDWVVKWTARYVCPEHHRGIQKFAQAMRVHKDAMERIDPKDLKQLQCYLRNNHPGYKNVYEDPDEDE